MTGDRMHDESSFSLMGNNSYIYMAARVCGEVLLHIRNTKDSNNDQFGAQRLKIVSCRKVEQLPRTCPTWCMDLRELDEISCFREDTHELELVLYQSGNPE